MASLTPGVLAKLLENAGHKDAKVTGEHRSPLLQVIEIVPSLASGDDPLQSSGFFLKVSDSMHSAYVSISDEDVDLIYSDKIQLGQLVHVAWLDSGIGSPVPILRGIKPLPRRRPCIGNPKDLVSSDLLPVRSTIDFKKSKTILGGFKKDGPKNGKGKRLGDGDCRSRRVLAGNGKVDGMELRRLSVDSSRRVWDQSPTPRARVPSACASRFNSKQSPISESASVFSEGKASFKKGTPLKCPSASIMPLKSRNDILPSKLRSMPLKTDLKAPSEGSLLSHLTKVPLNNKMASHQNIPWNLLPPCIQDLGKDAVSHRNAAFSVAVDALVETSAAEDVIHCMSMFANLCESSQKDIPGSLVQHFLDLHQRIQKARAEISALNNSAGTRLSDEEGTLHSSPNARNWVQAAVQTDLSKFRLFAKVEEKRDCLNNGRPHYIVLENQVAETKQNARRCGGRGGVRSTKKLNVEEEWSKGSGVRAAAALSENLFTVSRNWFWKYLEDSLEKGFGLTKGAEGSEIATLLGQLKRVNSWLEDAFKGENVGGEKIEQLRRKLYGFLLEHVDSTITARK